MKHTTSRKGAALAATAAVVTGAALWPSVAGADPSGHRSGVVITGTFTSDRVEEAFLDHDGNGRASLGDEIFYTNTTRGPLGRFIDHGRCSLHEVDTTAATVTLNCSATSRSGRSTITYQGSARTNLVSPGQAPRLLEPSTWAVTGGSGQFLRARGDVVITKFEGAGLDFRTSGRTRLIVAP